MTLRSDDSIETLAPIESVTPKQVAKVTAPPLRSETFEESRPELCPSAEDSEEPTAVMSPVLRQQLVMEVRKQMFDDRAHTRPTKRSMLAVSLVRRK